MSDDQETRMFVGLPPGVHGERDEEELTCCKCFGQVRLMGSQARLREQIGGEAICPECAIVTAGDPEATNEFVGITEEGKILKNRGGWLKSFIELSTAKGTTLSQVPPLSEGMSPAMMLPTTWRAGDAERSCNFCGETVYALPQDIAAVKAKYPDVVFCCNSCGFKIYHTQQEGTHRSEFYRIEPARGNN